MRSRHSKRSCTALSAQTQITESLAGDGAVRRHRLSERTSRTRRSAARIHRSAFGFGEVVTITGGQWLFGHGARRPRLRPFESDSRSARQGVYAQTTYQVLPDLSVSGRRQLRTRAGISKHRHRWRSRRRPATTRRCGSRATGRVLHRVSITAGLGYAHNEVVRDRLLTASVGGRLPANADADGVLERHAADLQRRAKASRRRTVFQATNSLFNSC